MMHGFIPPHRYFPYLTWTDIDSMPDKENVVIIQPIGAIEQHGPHLPIAVDAAISLGVLGKAFEKLNTNVPAFALPCLYYGKSNEHWSFPGTITLSATTLLTLIQEIAESLYRSGFRKLVLMNSHGGQPQVMEIAARDIHQQYTDFLVFPFFTWRVPHNAAELFSGYELEYGIHAGDVERLTKELTKSGVMGDATNASKEKGDRLLESVANGWVQAIIDVYQFRQPKLY